MSIEKQTDPRLGPTVYGIETEYSLLLRHGNGVVIEFVGECHSPDRDHAVLRSYPQQEESSFGLIDVESIRRILNQMGLTVNNECFLSNGARLYEDISGPEYSTPETRTAEEATHRTFDGDEILFTLLHQALKEGLISGFQLNRKGVDHHRSSRGIHLNSSIKEFDAMYSDEVIRILATLNIAKGSMFGSGGLLLGRDMTTKFHHSPRLSLTRGVERDFGPISGKYLVQFPFVEDVGDLRRVETVTSDALNFAWPIRASLVATNALIRMLELNIRGLPIVSKPVKAAVAVGQNGHEAKFMIDDVDKRKRVGAVEVMSRIAQLALQENVRYDFLDSESEQVLGEIIMVADMLERDWTSAASVVESVARLIYLERKMEQHGVAIDSERICRSDFAWDWIGGGIAEGLRKSNKAGWLGFSRKYSPHDTKQRILKPPQDTRAKFRAEEVAQGADYIMTWSNCAIEPERDDGTAGVALHPLDNGDSIRHSELGM